MIGRLAVVIVTTLALYCFLDLLVGGFIDERRRDSMPTYDRPKRAYRDDRQMARAKQMFDDRRVKRASKAFGAWFAFCALLGLALTGLVVWGFIELVLWVTSK